MKIFGWSIKNTKNDEQEVLHQLVTGEFIDSAYSRRSNEIESLRKYDRGEKTITPPNLRSLSKCI